MADNWVTATTMPDASQPFDGGFTRLPGDNTKLYYLGGHSGAGDTKTARIYTIATDSWTTGLDAPEVLGYCPISYGLGDSIFVVRHASNTLTPFQYKPSTNQWFGPLTGVALSGNDTSYGCGYNGKIYCWNHNAGRVYDPATNTWNDSIALRPAWSGDGISYHRNAGIGVLGNYLYAWGGHVGATTSRSADLDRYDPVTDTWVRITGGFPIDVSGVGYCSGGGYLWSIAGIRSGDVLTNRVFLSSNGTTWVEKAALPNASIQHQAVVAQQKVHACRVRAGNPSLHMVYNPDVVMAPEVGPFGGQDAQPLSLQVAPEPIPHRFTLSDFPGLSKQAALTLVRKLNENFDSAERQLLALDPDQNDEDPYR